MHIKKSIKKILFVTVVFFRSFTYAQENGGFEAIDVPETAPGMILVEGGLFHLSGSSEKSIKDTLPSFYISATEETNGQYLAYLQWMRNCYSVATSNLLLPDTTVWLKENISDSLKKFLVNNYLRSAAFRDYPVVGVSPGQVLKYACWKTDRVNEMILIREGILDFNDGMDSSNFFSLNCYLGGNWTGPVKTHISNKNTKGAERGVRMEDGLFMPCFRMLTENEWKLAALAIGDQQHRYLITPKEVSNRKFDKKNYFGFLFVKPKAVKNEKSLLLPDSIDLHPVYTTAANNYRIKGLYGNVSEWVVDATGRYIVAGSSWKAAGPYYAAVYKPVAGSGSYAYPFPFPGFNESMPSAAVGFRLAMSYTGAIDPRIKRRNVN